MYLDIHTDRDLLECRIRRRSSIDATALHTDIPLSPLPHHLLDCAHIIYWHPSVRHLHNVSDMQTPYLQLCTNHPWRALWKLSCIRALYSHQQSDFRFHCCCSTHAITMETANVELEEVGPRSGLRHGNNVSSPHSSPLPLSPTPLSSFFFRIKRKKENEKGKKEKEKKTKNYSASAYSL